jgi:hypothetical protein
MERSVLVYAGVFLVILVVVVEILIARFARRRESLDREVNVFSPNSRVVLRQGDRTVRDSGDSRGTEIETFSLRRARSSH